MWFYCNIKDILQVYCGKAAVFPSNVMYRVQVKYSAFAELTTFKMNAVDLQ